MPQPTSPYPPPAIALALAARSVALPGSSPAARRRLAVLLAVQAVHPEWSDETVAAQTVRAIDWLAIARHLGVPIPRLQRLDPELLLASLREPTSRSV